MGRPPAGSVGDGFAGEGASGGGTVVVKAGDAAGCSGIDAARGGDSSVGAGACAGSGEIESEQVGMQWNAGPAGTGVSGTSSRSDGRISFSTRKNNS